MENQTATGFRLIVLVFDCQKWPFVFIFVFLPILIFTLFLSQIRLVRGEFVDESGCPVPDWIGFIRAARNSQEQNLEAVSDLPGGQVNILTPPHHT